MNVAILYSNVAFLYRDVAFIYEVAFIYRFCFVLVAFLYKSLIIIIIIIIIIRGQRVSLRRLTRSGAKQDRFATAAT